MTVAVDQLLRQTREGGLQSGGLVSEKRVEPFESAAAGMLSDLPAPMLDLLGKRVPIYRRLNVAQVERSERFMQSRDLYAAVASTLEFALLCRGAARVFGGEEGQQQLEVSVVCRERGASSVG